MYINLKRFLIVVITLLISFYSISIVYAANIKIGLLNNTKKASVASYSNSLLIPEGSKKGILQLDKLSLYNFYSDSGSLVISNKNDEKRFKTGFNSLLIIPSSKKNYVYAKGRWYRGYLKLMARGNTVTVINVIDIEDYLKSVVPSEMPANWKIEALKAQAIAARSYALANLKKRECLGYDLKDDTDDQAYKGVASENSRSNFAVENTKNLVMVQGNSVIPAYYHSSSGGYTDNEAWSEKINFVRCVKDYDAASPDSRWVKNFTLGNLKNLLNRAGYRIDDVINIQVTKKSKTGRAKKLRIIGNNSSLNISGEEFRKALNLSSNYFSLLLKQDNLMIMGRGSGHGVGMSQWGAKALAEKGYTAYQILGYYFSNVKLKAINN